MSSVFCLHFTDGTFIVYLTNFDVRLSFSLCNWSSIPVTVKNSKFTTLDPFVSNTSLACFQASSVFMPNIRLVFEDVQCS